MIYTKQNSLICSKISQILCLKNNQIVIINRFLNYLRLLTFFLSEKYGVFFIAFNDNCNSNKTKIYEYYKFQKLLYNNLIYNTFYI